MKDEEFKKIKEEYQRYKDLLKEQKELYETLQTKKDLYANLQEIAWRLESIDDDLFEINDEEDIYRCLSDSGSFERIECGTDKKLYFFYGLVYEDEEKGEYWNGDYLVFVPRYGRLKPYIDYYAMYWDLVNSRNYELIPINKMKEFEKENYIIDVGEIDNPYDSDDEYNEIRQADYPSNKFQDGYDEYRIELFKTFVHSNSEKEATEKFVENYKRGKI